MCGPRALIAVIVVGFLATACGGSEAQLIEREQQHGRASPVSRPQCEKREPTRAERESPGFYAGCLPGGYQLAERGYAHPPPRIADELARERVVYLRDSDRATRITLTTVIVDDAAERFLRAPEDVDATKVRVRGHRGLRQSGPNFVSLRWAERRDAIVDVGGPSTRVVHAVAKDVRRAQAEE